MARISKQELEELQNADSWEDSEEPSQAPSKPARAVVSVALPREDFEIIVESAKQHGMKISEFIRRAAMEKATPKHNEALVLSVSGSVLTEYAVISGPRAKTEVRTNHEPQAYATA